MDLERERKVLVLLVSGEILEGTGTRQTIDDFYEGKSIYLTNARQVTKNRLFTEVCIGHQEIQYIGLLED